MHKFLLLGTLLMFVSLKSQEKIKLIDNSINPSDLGIYDKDFLPAEFHKNRREELRKLMPDNSVAFFFSAPTKNRSNDVDYEYHQDPNFYYLTGLREPNSLLVVYKDYQPGEVTEFNEMLFVQERNPKQEIWVGKRLGVEGAKQLLEFRAVIANSEFSSTELNLDSLEMIFYQKDKGDTRDEMGKSDLYDLQNHFYSLLAGENESKAKKKYKLDGWMAQLRQDKQEEELVLMRKAIDITCKAQTELMRFIKPGMKEYQTEALVEFHFKHEGAEYPGFPTIHGSGGNACILHYTENRKPMTKNELLVSDIGAEYHGYTADVTRTIPANGKYSKEQAIIYNTVLAAQTAGIEKCVEGAGFWDPHTAATKIIAKKLVELGIIKKESEVKKFFMHGTSHYLGLDVHDVGTYAPLTAGQVITVEPGIYIVEGSPCDEKWWNIGVRIEDDILITKGKPENLSDCVPRTIKEIEAIMSLNNKE